MSRLSDHPTVIRHRENSLTRVPDKSVLEASWLREVALAAGADDVGFVAADHPEIAAEHEDIRALLPDAKTLLSSRIACSGNSRRAPGRYRRQT